jgi:Ni/Fe-hydrogenase 1 B-type cytochrome subunit
LHWANAILIITLALLALSTDDMKLLGVEKPIRRPVKEIHAYRGYVFIFTLTLRIFWGFIGNQYARWSDIIPYTKKWRDIVGNIKWYFSGFKVQATAVIGHNPLASLFYILFF